MKCDDVKELLAEYLAGEADQEQRADVEAHLAICMECKQDAEMWARMDAWPEEQPGPALGARFNAMLTAYRAGIEQAELPPKRRISFRRWLESWWPQRAVLQFAVAAACLAIGIFAGFQIAGQKRGNGEMTLLREEVKKTRQLVAVSLLQQQSATERLRGVTYADRVDRPDDDVLAALVHTVKYDTSVDVRLAAVDALRRYSAQPSVKQGIIEALAPQQSPLVQIALIDLVVQTRLQQAAGTLKSLKDNRAVNELVRQRAEWGLQQF